MRSEKASVGLAVLVLAGGLWSGAPRARAGAKEDEVKKVFRAFQAALKANDSGKVYALLDSASSRAADRAARYVKSAYTRAADERKKKIVKSLGLPGAALAKLTGKSFLKSKPFRTKYDEVPGSTIRTVVIQGNRATVNYTEEDGDKEKLRLNRQQGKWKVSAPMPRVALP
jgi:hypothetical protein